LALPTRLHAGEAALKSTMKSCIEDGRDGMKDILPFSMFTSHIRQEGG
jgi:hypothetical protein